MRPARALTIAGSDSSAGAGVQADLDTFGTFGVKGACVVTAVTAQRAGVVDAVHDVPADIVDAQLRAALADGPVQAVKIGMLATAQTVDVVATRAARGELPNLVVDPVIYATAGTRLLSPDADDGLRRLLSYARVMTPNLDEAGALLGRDITTTEDMRAAARALRAHLGQCVMVTGGHLAGDPVDVVLDGDSIIELRGTRLVGARTHGTGCRFSAAVAACLARGEEPVAAARAAKEYVHAFFRDACT